MISQQAGFRWGKDFLVFCGRVWFALVAGMLLVLVTSAAESAPNYGDYPATNIFSGKLKEVDLSSHPKARRYRSVLSNGTAKGPNFAGQYRIATWGCGTECNEFAIVDCRTGRVFFIEEMPYVTWNRYPGKDPGLHFRTESRLLILEGSPVDGPQKGVFYYVWEKEKLKLIHSRILK